MLLGLILVLSIFLATMLCKGTHNYFRYAVVFIVGVIISFFFPLKVDAFELVPFKADLTESQMREVIAQKKKHKYAGEADLAAALQIKWYWPYLSDQDKARYCASAFAGLAAAGTPYSKIVGMFIAVLLQYSLDSGYEWHRLQTLLYSAQYHFELAEFYEEVLVKM